MRKNNLQTMTNEEKAIQEIMWKIEELGCDPLLTDVVVLLGQAKDKLSEFVDKE